MILKEQANKLMLDSSRQKLVADLYVPHIITNLSHAVLATSSK